MKRTVLLIIFYSTNLFGQGDFTFLTSVHGEKEGDQFSSVCSLGDVNGDGYDDFIVGGIGNYVKLYFGGSPFDTLNCLRFQSHEQYTSYAGIFGGGGDLNGDGYKDFVIGAAWDIFMFGKVFIYCYLWNR